MDEIHQILGEIDILRGLSSGASYRGLQRSLPRSLRERIQGRLDVRRKGESLEHLFRNMIASGEVRIERKRGRAPRIIPVTRKRRY